MSEPSNREREIFSAVLDLTSAQAREAYVRDTCGDDAGLRARVETLLRAHDAAGGFLPTDEATPPAAASAKTIAITMSQVAVTEKPGDRIGHYKIREKIGEGGCGVVYVAEQEEPVRRRVALKVIKLGMDTKNVIARFEAERQALAMMDHPNISKVLDAGTTDTGRPYFVMELVRGIKITDYCDQNRLNTRQRLDLFIQVCHAVQHAHQKGIIHRDIKPSNILVTLHDGVPVPKVIDFGIAKATEGRLTDLTVYTELHQFIGTPAYMSPEQAEMSGLDIDTRSDIYSLGVLLYELLTGQTPFDAKELIESGLDAMRKTIREKEPERPSTKLSQTLVAADVRRLKSSPATEDEVRASSRRLLQMKETIALLRGDLDWIVMKALEKDRTRRYETANGLAADLKRHLHNEPIVARPQSSAYRFQKLVRRNKLAFAAGGAVAVALVVGVIASTLQAVRATRAEREQSRLRTDAEASQKKSETEAAKATAISDFLQQLLRSANPDALKGSEYTVRQLLDDFSAGLANQLKDQPEVEAAVRATIGRAYYRLGVADKAQMHHERALALRRRIFGDQAEQVAESLVDNAWVCFEQQQYAKGEPFVREALEIYRKRGTAGQPVISALWVLQKLVSVQRQFTEMDIVTEQAVTIARKTPGIEFPEMASMIHGLAEAKNAQSQYAEAESLARKAIEMHRRLRGAEHPETGWALVSVGIALRCQQKLPEAEAAVREALKIFRKQYSSGHKSVELAMGELKLVLEARGDSAAVEALYREVLAGERAAQGNDSPAVAETLISLAASLSAQGKQAEAEKASREAMDIILKQAGPDLAKLPPLLRKRADTLRSQDKAAEAEKMYEQVIPIMRPKLGETNPILGQLLHDYGDHLINQWVKFEVAAELYIQSLPIRRLTSNDDLAETLRNLGDVLLAAIRPKEAEGYYRESLALYRKLHQQEDYWGTAMTTRGLAYALVRQDKLPESEQYFREALVAYSQTKGVGDPQYTHTVRTLVGVLKTQRKTAEVESLLKDVLAQQRKAPGELRAPVVTTLFLLADVFKSQNQPDAAVKCQSEASDIVANFSPADLLNLPEIVIPQIVDARLQRQLIAACHKVLALNPTNALSVDDVSWALITAQKVPGPDAALIVELVQKEAEVTGQTNAYILDTLAAAEAWAGNFTNAVRVEQEAIAHLHVEPELEILFYIRLKLYESNTRCQDYGSQARWALARLTEGNPAEAESLARESLATIKKQHATDWQGFDYTGRIGVILLELKQHEEAESLLLSAYDGMKRLEDTIPARHRHLTIAPIRQLARLYEATGKPEKAKEWRAKFPTLAPAIANGLK